MATGAKLSLFRDYKSRRADRSSFVEVMSRLSGLQLQKDERKQQVPKSGKQAG